MTSQKGISLISLIIYVIAMLITVTIITVITSYFYQNVDVTAEKYTYFSEFTKFETYMSEEVNISENKILKINQGTGNEQTYIAFSSGNQYTYIPTNNAIYVNNVKIASGVKGCEFAEGIENGHSTLKVRVSIQGNTENSPKIRQITYTLK